MLLRLFLALLAGTLGAASAAERPLTIDLPHSRVDIVVRASVDSFTGRLERFEPRVGIDEAGRVVSARFAFRFREVATGKPKRDEAMHGWQKTDEYPEGGFVLTSLEHVADSSGRCLARGQLTFHGVTREITFPASVIQDGSLYSIDGDATVDIREFGLPAIVKFLVLKVDPQVHVRFHLQGRDPVPETS